MAINRIQAASGGASAARDSTMEMLPTIGGVILAVILVFVAGYYLTKNKGKKK
ncbi:MAG: hypothetical protein HQL67_01165 [Magnetococcales bacterium]|nr:hypothetical protein [Magnetococcales bacterium]